MAIEPKLSVVVVTPDNYATVRKTIKSLRAQNCCAEIEIILVGPSIEDLEPDISVLNDFASYRLIGIGPVTSTARARAAGVHASSAAIVAFAEDHAYPAPGWAAALIRRHQENWAAVAPVMANANPRSITSWANLLIEYATWLDPCEGGERDHLPGHNGSYKHSVLMDYGDRLEAMLDAESILHWDLRAHGHRLYLEPQARTFHENFSAVWPSIPLRFNGGRLFAAARARPWPIWRRALFTVAAPLIPAVRCARIARELLRPGRPCRQLPRVLPALIFGLVWDGAGEMLGYACGAGKAMAILSDMEFHRDRFLSRTDKRKPLPVERVGEALS